MTPKIKKLLFPTIAALLIVLAVFVVVRSAEAPENTPPPQGGLPAIDPESIGKVVKDPSSGREFMSNQLIVEFQAGVPEESALRTIAGLNGRMISRFTNAPMFLIQVKDRGDGSGARATMENLKKNADVKNVDLNYIVSGLNTP